MVGEPEPWAVETSRDGERWRAYGRAWKWPGEPLLLHAAPRFVRYRRLGPVEDADRCEPLVGEAGTPMTLVRMEAHEREDVWPTEDHLGLPVLLPGGETGRLLAFEQGEGGTWAYTLEFRGP